MRFNIQRAFTTLAVALAMVITATSCAKKEDNKPEICPTAEYFTFDITDISHNGAKITVTASDELPVDWYWGVAYAEEGEDSLDNNDVADLMQESWELMVEYYETTKEEYPYVDFVSSLLLPANSSDSYTFDYLDPATRYFVWACGLNAEGEVVTTVEYTTFTTEELEFDSVTCYNFGDFYYNGTTNFLIDFYAGNHVYTLELIAPAGSVTPVGEYSIDGTQYALLPGGEEEDEEGAYLVGSYHGTLDEDDYFIDYGLITEGTVSIKRTNAKYQIAARCTDDYGVPVVLDYVGDMEIVDATEDYAAAAKSGSRAVVTPNHFRRVRTAK